MSASSFSGIFSATLQKCSKWVQILRRNYGIKFGEINFPYSKIGKLCRCVLCNLHGGKINKLFVGEKVRDTCNVLLFFFWSGGKIYRLIFFILQAQLIFGTQQSIYRLTDGVEN